MGLLLGVPTEAVKHSDFSRHSVCIYICIQTITSCGLPCLSMYLPVFPFHSLAFWERKPPLHCPAMHCPIVLQSSGTTQQSHDSEYWCISVNESFFNQNTLALTTLRPLIHQQILFTLTFTICLKFSYTHHCSGTTPVHSLLSLLQGTVKSFST